MRSLYAKLAKISLMLFVAGIVIHQYYSGSLHNEYKTLIAFIEANKLSTSAWLGYVFTILGGYGAYKWYGAISHDDDQTHYGLGAILGGALYAIIILCFFAIDANGAFVLAMKILGFLVLPTCLVLIAWISGKQLLLWADKELETRSTALKVIGSIALGMALLIFLVCIIGSLGFYNLLGVSVALVIMLAIGWKQIMSTLAAIWNFRISTGQKYLSFHSISTELTFFVLVFLVGVNFINIVRPMPIGWDDLGVYMNYPRIMAENGTVKYLGMVAWQSITGIGFFFRSATQAFFLNQIGGILSITFLLFAFTRIFSQAGEGKRHVLSMPMLLTVVLYAMPMIVFQQAKDMKLDPGLFAMSIAGIFIIYELLANEAQFQRKAFLTYLAIAGILAWTAFAIKPTTIMLLIGVVSTLFYRRVGLAGYLGFVAVFVGIFTKLRLWDFFNVAYPKDSPYLGTFSYLLIITGIVLMATGAYFVHQATKSDLKKFESSARTIFTKLFADIAVFALAAGIALSPWIVKNVSEVGLTHLGGVNGIINGSGYENIVHPEKARSADEFAAINEKNRVTTSSSGQTTNEDLGRYFGYETGINNYLKLPYNLTFQINQPGEYTEITFVYLALIPVAFLFLSFVSGATGLVGVLGLTLCILMGGAYYFHKESAEIIVAFFSQIILPNGYYAIVGAAFIPMILLHFTLDKTKKTSEFFLTNLSFLTVYATLFMVAAYGIVWYGIAMYFGFLLAIGLSFEKSLRDETEIPLNTKTLERESSYFIGVLVGGIIWIYFIMSALPHGWYNLISSGYSEFKSGTFSQEEAIFASHPNYLSLLANLNLKNGANLATTLMSNVKTPEFKMIVQNAVGTSPSPTQLDSVIGELLTVQPGQIAGLPDSTLATIKQEAQKMRETLYEKALYPTKEERNEAGIYRIGTFLTYFISNNRARYLDDSLVTTFDSYFYDKDPSITIDRMKAAWAKYLLIDLNAATIDRDPRHDLTKRYEHLLQTVSSSKLRFIESDSYCLQVALEEKATGKLKDSDYLTLAGVNYESYAPMADGQEWVIPRSAKLNVCQSHIVDLITNNAVSKDHYASLLPMANYLKRLKMTSKPDVTRGVKSLVNQGYLALFEIR